MALGAKNRAPAIPNRPKRAELGKKQKEVAKHYGAQPLPETGKIHSVQERRRAYLAGK